MWQTYTLSNSLQAYYRDLLAKLVQVATSKHISAAVPNAAGSGYAVGDILSYTHASALLGATFEVLTINGSNQPTSLRVISGGAFGRRVATVAVGSSGGTGYAVGDIVEINQGHVAGTDFRQRCKIRVDTAPAGVVSAVSIWEGGGNYEGGTDPAASDSTTTKIGPAAGTGSGLLVNTTMQAITGTSAVSLTTVTGVGTGATADLTLTNTGWFTLRDDHNYTTPHGETDEKQVVLQGTVSGGDAPLMGYISWFDESGANDYWGLLEVVMDFYNDALALENQVGANASSDVPDPSNGAYIPSFNEAESGWFSMDGRSIRGVHKITGNTVTAYAHHGLGLLDPKGTVVESPYPMFQFGAVSGTTVWDKANTNQIDMTGFCEAFRHTSRNGPLFARRQDTGTYGQCINGQGTGFPVTPQTARSVWPIGASAQAGAGQPDLISGDGNFTFTSTVVRNDGGTPTLLLKPAPGSSQHQLWHAVIEARGTPPDFGPMGRIPNVYWVAATKSGGGTLGAEDTLRDPNDPSKVYRVFPTGVRTTAYSFIAMQEA